MGQTTSKLGPNKNKALKAAIDVLKTFQGDKVATGTFVSALAKGADGKAP